MKALRASLYASIRSGASRPGAMPKRKKKAKPRQLSREELAKLRIVLSKEKASGALY